MNLDSDQENGIQLVFGDPALAGAAVVRFDFVLEENEEQMYEGFSEIYSDEIEEYYTGGLGIGGETREYYASDTNHPELDVFEDVQTHIFREHDHIIDLVTVAELSQSQIARIKLVKDFDFIWETQRSLNIFHNTLPTISNEIRDRKEINLANILFVILPESVPVTYSDNTFDQTRVKQFLETFQGLRKIKFYNRPLTGYNPLAPIEYLLSPQMPNYPFGPLSVIALRSGQKELVEPSWLSGLYGLIPYYRAFDWVNYRWEQLENTHDRTYNLSSVFGEEPGENLTPEEYRNVILEARENWSEVNKTQDELRSFNGFLEDTPGSSIQNEHPPETELLSYGSGMRIGMPITQYFKKELNESFQELQSDLDRVEEKQTTVLRYLQAEVSAESSIQSLVLEKRINRYTLILLFLTLLLVVFNKSITDVIGIEVAVSLLVVITTVLLIVFFRTLVEE